jgi:predicted acylesterase/phospholipase RssA
MSVTSLRGEVRPLASRHADLHKEYRDEAARAPHTRYEETYTFTEKDLTDESRHEMIAQAAIASSAIPVVFATGFVGTHGPYVDGGLVNNAPISLAIRDHDAVDRVLIVTPEPAIVPPGRSLGRFSVATLLEIVLNERLARDLSDAYRFNGKLARLREALTDDDIRKRTGWRTLDIIEIRPEAMTPGNLLSGFFLNSQRVANLQLGQDAARRALDKVQSETVVQR